MSIIAKFPWHRGEYYTVLQRDHLFEALKSIPPQPTSMPLFLLHSCFAPLPSDVLGYLG